MDCSNGCGVTLKRNEIDVHATECPQRQVDCQYCKEKICYLDLEVCLCLCGRVMTHHPVSGSNTLRGVRVRWSSVGHAAQKWSAIKYVICIFILARQTERYGLNSSLIMKLRIVDCCNAMFVMKR